MKMAWKGVLAAALLWSGSAAAQEDCYLKVVEFAEGICAEFVGTSGGQSRTQVQGQINAEMAGLLKKLTDLGGEFGADYTQQEYENILRKDVPDALEQGRQCRLQVATTFFDKICTPRPAPAAAPAPAASPFNLRAQINDPDGWTNVRTGQGTQYPVLLRIYQGEVFRTKQQAGDWWQVETPQGEIGYMHRSRISLLAR